MKDTAYATDDKTGIDNSLGLKIVFGGFVEWEKIEGRD